MPYGCAEVLGKVRICLFRFRWRWICIYEIEFSVADKENYYDTKQYANPTELTAELLYTLIEKIVIHEAATVDGMREQNIDIYYRLIGKIA